MGRQHSTVPHERKSSTDDNVEVHEALSTIRPAIRGHASATIEATADPQHAFEQATALHETTDELAGQATNLRARMVTRIWKAEEIPLASLAKRIGVPNAPDRSTH
jgi:hypothetical protein